MKLNYRDVGRQVSSKLQRPLYLLLSTALLACAAPAKQIIKSEQKPAPLVEKMSDEKAETKKSISDGELAALFAEVGKELSFPSYFDLGSEHWLKGSVNRAYTKLEDLLNSELEGTRDEVSKVKIALAGLGIVMTLDYFFERGVYAYDEDKRETKERYERIKNLILRNLGYEDYYTKDPIAALNEIHDKYKTDQDFAGVFDFIKNLFRIIKAAEPSYKSANELILLDESDSDYAALVNLFIGNFNAIQRTLKRDIDYKHNFPHRLLNQRFPFFPLRGVDVNPNMPQRRFRLNPPFEKPVVINLWGIGCKPCIKEMPELDKIHRSGIATVLGYQVPSTDFLYTRDELRNEGLPIVSFPLITSNEPGYRDFEISYNIWHTFGQALPITIILDKKGKIKRVIVGITSENELLSIISNLLEQ